MLSTKLRPDSTHRLVDVNLSEERPVRDEFISIVDECILRQAYRSRILVETVRTGGVCLEGLKSERTLRLRTAPNEAVNMAAVPLFNECGIRTSLFGRREFVELRLFDLTSEEGMRIPLPLRDELWLLHRWALRTAPMLPETAYSGVERWERRQIYPDALSCIQYGRLTMGMPFDAGWNRWSLAASLCQRLGPSYVPLAVADDGRDAEWFAVRVGEQEHFEPKDLNEICEFLSMARPLVCAPFGSVEKRLAGLCRWARCEFTERLEDTITETSVREFHVRRLEGLRSADSIHSFRAIVDPRSQSVTVAKYLSDGT